MFPPPIRGVFPSVGEEVVKLMCFIPVFFNEDLLLKEDSNFG